jgi:hypothetical protein
VPDIELPRTVVIFDDSEITGLLPYKDAAVQAVEAVGYQPEVFDEVGPAEYYLNTDERRVRLVITGLGMKLGGGTDFEYTGEIMIACARFRSKPSALVSDNTHEVSRLEPKVNIVVPEQPYDVMAFVLRKWLKRWATSVDKIG